MKRRNFIKGLIAGVVAPTLFLPKLIEKQKLKKVFKGGIIIPPDSNGWEIFF